MNFACNITNLPGSSAKSVRQAPPPAMDARHFLSFVDRLVDRKNKRGFGAMAREVIFCTEARSATTANILTQTVADLCDQ